MLPAQKFGEKIKSGLSRGMTNAQLQKTRLADYKPFEFEISAISLVFNLNENRTRVASKLNISRKNNPELAEADLLLNGVGLILESIKINGRVLSGDEYEKTPSHLRIKTKESKFELEIIVYNNPSANTALSGLYISGGGFCTQCEAEGFRNITYWPDRPDVMARFFVRIEAPKDKYPILLANGDCVSFGDYEDGRHFAEWNDPWPKPAHLFALVAGDFDKLNSRFVTMENREVDINIFVDKGQADKAHYALDSLKRAMKWDEDIFGCAYDLDTFNIVAVRDFNFGAMENKGLNIFNSRLILADKDTATDTDYERIEAVVAHEYFHNWSGNRVNCRDWFQLSLKEGLTVFRDQEFSADMRARAVKRIQDVITLREVQFIEDSGTNAHSVRPSEYASIDNFYTATIYEKGAEIIRLTRNILGEAAFNKAVRHYFKTFDGSAATIEDWLWAMRESSGNDLVNIENWYSQAGTPIVKMDTEFDPAQKLFTLKLSQETPDTPGQINKGIVPIPSQIAFYENDGQRLRLGANNTAAADALSFNFNSKEAVLEFDGLEVKPIVSILRGFSAPVKLISDQNEAELLVLANFDNDAFVRWESVQTLARNAIISSVQNSNNNDINQNFIDLFSKIISESKSDFAFAAQLLKLPSTIEIMSHIQNSEPEKIAAAIEKIYSQIYKANSQALHHIYDEFDFTKEFNPSAKDAGERAFFAQCLNLLRFAPDNAGEKMALNAFENAKNMTDTISSLNALSKIGGEYYQNALSIFANKWRANDLVMDKWFSIQAAAPSIEADKVFEALIQNPLFNNKNPNRVRAVGGSFGFVNHAAFHKSDGSGYSALLKLIGEIDPINPNVAAKMATAFERITMVEVKRRKIAKELLQNFAKAKLSTQLSEVINTVISGA